MWFFGLTHGMNECCCSVLNIFFPFLLKNVRAMYRTVTLPFVLCGPETWFLTSKECRLRIFASRVVVRNPNSEAIHVL
jgi:hypothetical protein